MRTTIALIALVALGACRQQGPAAENVGNQIQSGVDAGSTKGVDRSHRGQPVPDKSFNDPDGKPTKLAAFSGKPVLVNLWASWCAPCVKELPTLDRLADLGSIRVLAVSQDSGPHESVVAFLKAHRITRLGSYQDPQMGLSGALGAEVLPTSILYDASGKEVWRYVGELDWTSPAAAKLLSEAGAGPTAG